MDWIRNAFPRARVSAPGDRYLRIRHVVRGDAVRRQRLDRLQPDLIFFDLETLGFLGHPLFLIGLLLRRPRDRWEVVQLLARDYTEEAAVLRAFARTAPSDSRWVSFNGKSFDLPVLKTRATFHGLPFGLPMEHFDLLHEARRLYQGILPNCRLGTLERRLLGVYRSRDLDGGEVPAAYHAFVRGGDPEAMVRILRHNRTDVVSLARLLLHLEGLEEEQTDDGSMLRSADRKGVDHEGEERPLASAPQDVAHTPERLLPRRRVEGA